VTRAANPKLMIVVASAALAMTSAAWAQTPVGDVYASDASVRGSMIMTSSGTRVMSGSQVAAGENVALMRLLRGGEIRICRGTSLALSEKEIGAPMLFGINSGSIELHYPITAISDSVVTPDFRIQLTGPGLSHIALGADLKGNTCVKAMEGNTASVIVSEMMGSGTYHVAVGRSVVFHEGKLEQVSDSAAVCGCPAEKPAAPVVQVAKEVTPKPVAPELASATPSVVEMDAPLVFKAKTSTVESDQERLQREGVTIATLRVKPLKVSKTLLPQMKVAKKPKTESKGFWGFFRKLFGG
jgi:hypothetical protein